MNFPKLSENWIEKLKWLGKVAMAALPLALAANEYYAKTAEAKRNRALEAVYLMDDQNFLQETNQLVAEVQLAQEHPEVFALLDQNPEFRRVFWSRYSTVMNHYHRIITLYGADLADRCVLKHSFGSALDSLFQVEMAVRALQEEDQDSISLTSKDFMAVLTHMATKGEEDCVQEIL